MSLRARNFNLGLFTTENTVPVSTRLEEALALLTNQVLTGRITKGNVLSVVKNIWLFTFLKGYFNSEH